MAWSLKFNFPTTNWDPSATTYTTRSAVAGSAVAVGDTIVLAVPYRRNGNTTVTVADDLGNIYTEVTDAAYYAGATWSYIGVRFFYANITVAGTPTVTATLADASSYVGVFATAYQGLSSTPFQVTVAAVNRSGVAGTTDALASSNANVTTAPVLVYGFAYAKSASSGYTLTAGTGLTSRLTGQDAGATRHLIRTEDKRVTASGNTNITFTPNFGGVDCTAVVIVFSEAITAPTIQGGTAAPVHQSTGNTLTGVNFGASQTGSAAAVIGGAGQTETGWNATTVTYTADRGINGNGIAVNAVITDPSGVASDPYALTGFQPPAGWTYVTLTSVWPIAAQRLQSSADLAIGNQIEWDDDTIEVTDSGVPIWPPGTPAGYTFNFRVWVSGSGWGATEVATLNPAAASSGTAGRRLAIGLGIGI